MGCFRVDLVAEAFVEMKRGVGWMNIMTGVWWLCFVKTRNLVAGWCYMYSLVWCRGCIDWALVVRAGWV